MENKELLQRANNEIKQLRSQNQLMAARLDMFDSMMAIFNAQQLSRGGMMHPDIVYEIEKAIENEKHLL